MCVREKAAKPAIVARPEVPKCAGAVEAGSVSEDEEVSDLLGLRTCGREKWERVHACWRGGTGTRILEVGGLCLRAEISDFEAPSRGLLCRFVCLVEHSRQHDLLVILGDTVSQRYQRR